MLWSLNMLHWSRCADLRLHNGEIAYTSTIWESFTCCLILTVDSKPIKKAGCLVFPCCIAAISTAFDLKNASPLFLCLRWWWLTLQHTLQKSPLMHPRGRERRGERKRKKREGYFCLCACNTQCLFMCPDLPYTNTCTHLHSLQFPAGWKCSWCVCTARVYYVFFGQTVLICNNGMLELGWNSSDAFNISKEGKQLLFKEK